MNYRKTARRLLLKHAEEPAARLLSKMGLSPNILTLLGLALAGGSAYLISTGHFLVGGLVLLASGVFDILDGALARVTHRITPFGAVLDSIADRIAEAGVLLGLMVFYLNPVQKPELILVYLTLTGSVLVSYLRARGEALGVQYSGGVMTRPERLLLLVLGLMINQVPIVLGIIVALTFLTSGQRLLYIWKALRQRVD